MNSRIQRIANCLPALESDAVLVTDERNVRYLTGFTGDSTAILIGAPGVVILSDGRYKVQLEQQCGDFPTLIRPPEQKLTELIGQAISENVISGLKIKRLAIESENLTMATYSALEKSLRESGANATLVSTQGVVEQFRQIKDQQEIETTIEAVRIAEQAIQRVLATITLEKTEKEIALELEIAMRQSGADGVSFDPIVGAGETGALPHYQPGDRKLGEETSLLIDWGARYQGYASDITRTFHRSGVSDEFRRCYDAVLRAQLAAIDAIAPGVDCSKIDSIARQSLEKDGLGEAFLHSLGHGIGLQIHEGPRLGKVGGDVLREGMIVTVEPGVYFGGNFGIRIEDDVLVTDSGHRVLSSLPKGLDDCRIML